MKTICYLMISVGHLFFQLKEEESVYGSDEEVDESPEAGSDEDLSDGEKEIHEEVWVLLLVKIHV